MLPPGRLCPPHPGCRRPCERVQCRTACVGSRVLRLPLSSACEWSHGKVSAVRMWSDGGSGRQAHGRGEVRRCGGVGKLLAFLPPNSKGERPGVCNQTPVETGNADVGSGQLLQRGIYCFRHMVMASYNAVLTPQRLLSSPRKGLGSGDTETVVQRETDVKTLQTATGTVAPGGPSREGGLPLPRPIRW